MTIVVPVNVSPGAKEANKSKRAALAILDPSGSCTPFVATRVLCGTALDGNRRAVAERRVHAAGIVVPEVCIERGVQRAGGKKREPWVSSAFAVSDKRVRVRIVPRLANTGARNPCQSSMPVSLTVEGRMYPTR